MNFIRDFRTDFLFNKLMRLQNGHIMQECVTSAEDRKLNLMLTMLWQLCKFFLHALFKYFNVPRYPYIGSCLLFGLKDERILIVVLSFLCEFLYCRYHAKSQRLNNKIYNVKRAQMFSQACTCERFMGRIETFFEKGRKFVKITNCSLSILSFSC